MAGHKAATVGSGRELNEVATVAELRRRIAAWREAGETVALVPTMGFLHRAHLSLIGIAHARCTRVITSIFVNPAQFGAGEDFASYPRDPEGDIAQLRAAAVDIAFVPALEEVYPPGFATKVAVAGLTDGLCGPRRPGHFDGVATVVAKLLIQSLLDVAVFGEKDYQQLQMIRRMTRDLDLPVAIAAAPTVREADGLALSSRNVYLSAAERALAPALFRALGDSQAALARGMPVEDACRDAAARLAASGFDPVDYVEVCDSETLEPVERLDRPARILAAAWLGRTRLIDNVPAAGARAGQRT
ncbi:MAG TPA: pantoate--beta-alanine ligase [Alphaproteobacteria bacterium]